MLSWLNLWTSMSVRQTFRRVYGVQMICSMNGLQIASVRNLNCSHSSHSCIRLWLHSAHGYTLNKLSHYQFSTDLCGAGIFSIKAALQKTRSEQATASQSKRTQINFTTPAKAPPANPYDKVVSRHSSRFHPYSRPR